METKEKTTEKNYGSQIDSTVKTIEDHVEKKSTSGVAGAINKWIDVLEDHKGLKTIASNLNKLKEAVESKDSEKIVSLLETLGEQTTKAADEAEGAEATKIKHLGKALTTASKAIAKFV
jgi:uncharacterized protein YukE